VEQCTREAPCSRERLPLAPQRGEDAPEVHRPERLLGWAQAVAEIATAAGRPIRYLPVSLEEYAALLIENQVPADYVKMLTDVFTEVLDGRNAHLADGVQRALGRPPRDFADYARAAAATGVWSGSAAA